MVRTIEQWMEIIAATPPDQIGKRVLGDITHYHTGRTYEPDDQQQIAHVLEAVRRLTEQNIPKR